MLARSPVSSAPRTAAVPVANVIRERALAPLAAFMGAHVILAMVMRSFPSVGMVHAGACIAVGLVVAARRRLQEVAFIVAYIVGAEVLWRMTHANVFWEFGKYAISLILIVALLRVRVRRNRMLAIAYFGMLVPSILLTVLALSLEVGRQQLSFNLSGPLALTLCVLFFSNIRLQREELHTAMFALLGPVVAIGTLAFYSTTTARDLHFFGDSNATTSGGFGPNQVSAMLGLGLLFSLLMLLERRASVRLQVSLLVLAVLLATQAALTFSRGGLTMAFAGAAAAMFYLVRNSRTRITFVILAMLLFGIGKYVVVPRLEVFTAGKLGERYTDLDPSGRTLIAGFDLQLFVEHPLLGVGPGVAPALREEIGKQGAAHTEFTRLLAEHGLLGILAIVFLLILGVRTVRGAATLQARAFVVAMLVWFTLFLLVNAMRLAAPAFVFGLACSIAYASRPLPGAKPVRA